MPAGATLIETMKNPLPVVAGDARTIVLYRDGESFFGSHGAYAYDRFGWRVDDRVLKNVEEQLLEQRLICMYISLGGAEVPLKTMRRVRSSDPGERRAKHLDSIDERHSFGV